MTRNSHDVSNLAKALGLTLAAFLASAFLASASSAAAAVLIDLNDGDNSSINTTSAAAAAADFEAALGLTSGALSGETVLLFNNNGEAVASGTTQTVGGVTVDLPAAAFGNEADGFFPRADNPMLSDGVFLDPNESGEIELSGVGLNPNTAYEITLFAIRAGGHDTTFTFDPANPSDPSNGTSINLTATSGETNAAATFSFTTGASTPASLNIDWESGNQSGEFGILTGIALIPEPASAALVALGTLSLLPRRRRG